MNRLVLAYSGGFAASAMIGWLAEQQAAEVVTVTLDIGQGRELAAVRERALASGAVRAHVIDAREEFVRDFVQPALQAGVFAAGRLDRVASLACPLIARRLVEIARMESASLVAHGGRPGSSSEAALHAAIGSLDPALRVLAPLREWPPARASAVPVPPAERWRTDANLWGRVVEPVDNELAADAFVLTRAAAETPRDAAFVEIDLVAGVPVRANGVEMPLVEMIESLETIAGAHGVGRLPLPDGRAVEAPAAHVLAAAHGALTEVTLGADLAALQRQLAVVYVRLIDGGRWFSDVREGIDTFVRILQPRVSGQVRVRLSRGECTIADVRASRPAAGAPSPKAVA
ncbi:MAG TPA: argininosuccinate synthase domain-containing protein [Vicinamibacterales bacterium]|nr:argininosuccinate synthase domain-containing protein [Vicinamibacterales bacterium]